MKISTLLNTVLLFAVCGSVSVYATQSFVDDNTIKNSSEIDFNSVKFDKEVTAIKVNFSKGESDDVIIVPMGQCSPMPFCQQLER
ncbi:hypothetical protein FM038_004080 [Shewanella eurypsychrophilus]|uniref:Uncharacterized protein n=1 Tax=Shewanella eurypsychrophilus TaxID=2593656 RepID=A0ABX6V4J0_9GAMM|nr:MULTISPECIES: hypothetical protein [Shewanella]QFU21405.1 hypothetical protein FS418_05660 [Shewanella sp. YLB-09]QPG56695.1 hypothetical protein FM038_004080 [Shewanella eurypsychrophilus]